MIQVRLCLAQGVLEGGGEAAYGLVIIGLCHVLTGDGGQAEEEDGEFTSSRHDDNATIHNDTSESAAHTPLNISFLFCLEDACLSGRRMSMSA